MHLWQITVFMKALIAVGKKMFKMENYQTISTFTFPSKKSEKYIESKQQTTANLRASGSILFEWGQTRLKIEGVVEKRFLLDPIPSHPILLLLWLSFQHYME